MASYRVDIDGETVWSDSDDSDTPDVLRIPAEHLARPASGEPAKHLFVNDECVGVQISHDEEAAALTTEAEAATAAGDLVLAAQLRAILAQNAVHASIEKGA